MREVNHSRPVCIAPRTAVLATGAKYRLYLPRKESTIRFIGYFAKQQDTLSRTNQVPFAVSGPGNLHGAVYRVVECELKAQGPSTDCRVGPVGLAKEQ